jgi:glycosyltransferase involved in cell wall biosynthesis
VESFLMQQTTFPFEIIIHDDASADKTGEILKEYEAKYPNVIKCLYQKKNQYSLGVRGIMAKFTFPHARGKYIALCEGDDYWTDPFKLQKQIDYISKHENCNLVFTDVKLLEESNNKLESNWATITKDIYRFKDIVQANVITTCTVLFRNSYRKHEIENWLTHFNIGDYPLYLFLLRDGYAYFLKDITSVYRQHSGGIFSLKGIEHLINKNIEVLEVLEKLNLSKQEFFYVRKSLIRWYYTKVVRMSDNLQFDQIRTFIKKKVKWTDTWFNLTYFLKILFLFLFPQFKAGVFQRSEMPLSN